MDDGMDTFHRVPSKTVAACMHVIDVKVRPITTHLSNDMFLFPSSFPSFHSVDSRRYPQFGRWVVEVELCRVSQKRLVLWVA